MSGIALLKPGQRWKAVLLVLAACAAILAVGVLVGYASGRSRALGRRGAAQPPAASTELSALQQLPLPGSAAAQQWLADPAAPEWLRDVYTHYNDSVSITAEHTEAFFKLLQQAVKAHVPAPAPGSIAPAAFGARSLLQQKLQLWKGFGTRHIQPVGSSSTATSSSIDLETFIVAAGDVLSYLRCKHSHALLAVLRDFSRHGFQGLNSFATSGGELRQEVQQLISSDSLQQWYLDTAASRVGLYSRTQHHGAQVLSGSTWAAHLQHPSRRRLLSADSDTMPYDLTSALLNKMMHSSAPAAAAITQISSPVAPNAAPAAALYRGAAAAGWQEAAADTARTATTTAGQSGTVADADDLTMELYDYDDGDREGSDGSQFTADTTGSRMTSTGVARGAGEAVNVQHRPHRPASSNSAPGAEDTRDNNSRSGGLPSAVAEGRLGLLESARLDATPAEPDYGDVENGWVTLQSVPGEGDALQQAGTSSMDVAATQLSEYEEEETAAAAGPAVVSRANARQENETDTPLCAMQQFSPHGLQGQVAGVCPAVASGPSLEGLRRFGPTIIPVIFHCLTFTMVLPRGSGTTAGQSWAGAGQVVLPPSWDSSKAAGNLIDQANKAFLYTGIQFALLEVRQDPAQHAYLMQPSLEAWQRCAYSPASPATGIACLQDVALRAAAPSPAHAIHVFVAGSRQERAYCDSSHSAVCDALASGYSYVQRRTLTWQKQSLADNWIYVSRDTFNPATSNSARYAHRGGSIFASQLAQYLGVKPDSAAAAGGRTECTSRPQLASWCSAFRQGLQLPTELPSLLQCPVSTFGIMQPSVLDACAMLFTKSQVADLQAAAAAFGQG